MSDIEKAWDGRGSYVPDDMWEAFDELLTEICKEFEVRKADLYDGTKTLEIRYSGPEVYLSIKENE